MKKYNGIELLQAIKNKEIEPDTKISIKGRFNNKAMYIKAPSNKFLYQDDFQIYEEDGKPYDKGMFTVVIVASDLLNYTFEIADKSILDEKEKELEEENKLKMEKLRALKEVNKEAKK